ncbi:gliding motility protein GldM [Polaribacter sp. IC073]|uniref:type IX secretion system motor protein PorM/GldM n=1 Tax=Polaribacter sp. IC073 TaxID=2508540 RepID=UPI0011BDD035|nr:gliding motility protein GldM [Polaribacter sp. IC073]TXD47611.1 gliding motility protein GldM [Polaribacter sp. IC073]
MAGGKMSARQKMINLMYLVFIAMLAMQMDKEVLSAFGYTNEKLVDNNLSTAEKNALAYTNLSTKASEQPAKFGPLKQKADKIKEYSSEYYQYLAALKIKMTAEIEDKDDYEQMDKMDWLDAHFFKGDGYTIEGQEFLDNINGYRTNMIQVLGANSKFIPAINDRFNTEDVDRGGNKTEKWLKARYEGFPMVASLTNFTQIQADIKNTESDIISDLLGGQLESEVSMSNYNGVVQLDKNAFYPGDKVTGSIVLGRYDPNLKPSRVELNGKNYENFKDGSVILDLNAGGVGDKDIKGTIYFMENGEEVPVPFKSSYSVIAEPSSAVVSADKMNVVYRGLDNPISVSLPGVSSGDLNVSASGGKLSRSGSGFIVRPGGGATTKINVSATLSSGKKVTSSSTFRVKDIPAAMGSVRGQYGTVRMPKSGLTNAPITAGLPDFEFDLKIRVQSFKIKVPGELTIIVNGDKLSAAAKKVLSKARRGDIINIYGIKATANGTNLKKVLPVNIELTN